MLRSLRSLVVVMFACAVAVPSSSASSPWDGTWKLNQEKSQLTGTTLTLTKSGNVYHERSSQMERDYECDGKEHPDFGSATLICRETPTTMELTRVRNGKPLSTIKRELDPGGKTYHSVFTSMLPGGEVDRQAFERVGTGSGFVGTWRRISTAIENPGKIVVRVNGDSLHLEYPNSQWTWDGKLDGTPKPVSAANAATEAAVAAKLEGGTKLQWVEMLGRRPVQYHEATVSADGKTLTVAVWGPNEPEQKNILVFDKQ